MPESARHRFVEHTGELELEVDAPDACSALIEVARALCQLIARDSPLGPLSEPERVSLSARDPESLLADWVNELVYLGETRKRVYPEVVFEQLSLEPPRLEASVRGAEPASVVTPVKAASMHRLSFQRTPRGVHARVVLDV